MRGLSSVVCVAVILAVVAGDQHQKELKEHYDHLAYIAEFNCHRPQPRVISVHELFPEKDTKHKAFFPDVTVLHRCDNAVGCCPSNHHCRPKHTHPLHLPFKVTFLEQMGKHKKGSWVIDYHSFDNHTECECVDISVCVPPTEHEEEVHIGGSSHKPEHHPEHKKDSHHEPDHHSESHHEPDHHTESHHEPDHHTESHHEPDHHTESHHEPDHHTESHHEPDHHSESHHEPDHKPDHHEESHHEPDHHSESDHHGESDHKTEYHTESSHKTEQHSSSYKPDQSSGDSYPSSSSSLSPSAPSSSPDDQQVESSTVPLLVNYILSSSSTSTTEKIDGTDISSFFD